ncbi:MAG TPA: hypothetical protein VM597_17220 [Gemmataceae bacterium]|jgi:hypothetical protein|nr:hypothetical protein [Gemmataceae bacterium]
MPWAGRYYYRSVPVNGRPRRQNVGPGLLGQLACQLDNAARERKALSIAHIRLARADAEAIDDDLLAIEDLADAVARAALVAAGFRRHKRGEWRRKREGK